MVQHHCSTWVLNGDEVVGVTIWLSSAPYIFTKIMCPLELLWCSKGIEAIMYLDDSIVVLPNESCVTAASALVRDTLGRAAEYVMKQGQFGCQPDTLLAWVCLEKGYISVS